MPPVAGVGSSLTIAGATTLIYDGTTGSDTFNVTGTGIAGVGFISLSNVATLPVAQLPVITTAAVTNLVLNGISGDDTFNVGTPQPYLNIALEGGPSDPSVATLTGDGTSTVVATLGGPVPTVVGGNIGLVTLTGIGVINISNGAGSVTVAGIAGAGAVNNLAVTPTSATTANIQDNGKGPWVVATVAAAAVLTVNPTTTGTVTVNGSGGVGITASGGAAAPIVTVGALIPVALVPADTSALVVNSGLGAVGLTVDSTAGAFPTPITFNGQGSGDFLNLKDTGAAAMSDTYTPGPATGAGTSTIVFPSGTQTVNFTGLSPVFDFVTSPTATVVANAASSAILYAEGDAAPNTPSVTWGAVTVNNLETYNFIHKAALVINGMAGSDSFDMNNPNVPTGLTVGAGGITINGTPQNATASSTLLVNGTPLADAITYTPTTPSVGSVAITGFPTVGFNGIASLAINGQGGGDSLTVTSPTGSQVTLTPGSAIDSGTLTFTSGGAAPSTLTPLTYSNLGGIGQSAIGAQLTVGGAATLIYNSIPGNYEFLVTGSATPGMGTISLQNHGATPVVAQIPVITTGVTNLILNGISGDGSFNVSAAAALPYTSGIRLEGNAGVPTVATLTGSGAALAMVLGDPATTVTGGGLGTVTMVGVGAIQLNAGGGALGVTGSPSLVNNLAVTPTGAATAQIQDNGTGPLVYLTGSGTLTVGGGVTGSDIVTVNGTAGNDTILVTGTPDQSDVTVNRLVAGHCARRADYHRAGHQLGAGHGYGDRQQHRRPVTVPVTYDGGPTDSLVLKGGRSDHGHLYPRTRARARGEHAWRIPGGSRKPSISPASPRCWTRCTAPTLTVNGNSSNNVINYHGRQPAGLGLVTVDNFEPITFSSKVDLGHQLWGRRRHDHHEHHEHPDGPDGHQRRRRWRKRHAGGQRQRQLRHFGGRHFDDGDDPAATPVAVGYTGMSQISIINSKDALDRHGYGDSRGAGCPAE